MSLLPLLVGAYSAADRRVALLLALGFRFPAERRHVRVRAAEVAASVSTCLVADGLRPARRRLPFVTGTASRRDDGLGEIRRLSTNTTYIMERFVRENHRPLSSSFVRVID